jgi:DnaK suppressor protein
LAKTPKRRAAKPASKKPKARGKPAAKPTAAPKKAAPAPMKAVPKAKPKPVAAKVSSAKPVFVAPAPPPRMPSGLSKKEIEQFRDILILKRAELAGDVKTLRDEALAKNRQDAAGNLSSMPIHMADLGTDHYEQEFTLGLMESERTLLGEIEDALHRIERGEYGVCEATGRPIGKARLRAKPWAKHCYEYVMEQEKGRRGG